MTQERTDAGKATPEKAPGIGGMRHSRVVERLRSVTPGSVVEVARSGARSYGKLTASARPMPDFLVIGAKKGGTTSVANWLAQHPDVMPMFPRMQRRKSPHYFDMNYWRGETWYRSHFPTRTARWAHSRRTGVGAVTGETSPYYLFHPWAAQRIKESAPDVRLIAVLREPVSRAYSNYWDRFATGNETLDTFEQAIDAEESRLAGVSDESLRDPKAYSFDHDHHTYLARGRYAEQLRRYFELFDREQLLVLTADELRSDPHGSFERVVQLLGVRVVPMELKSVNVRSGQPPLDPATKERLRAYYAPHNQELYELLGTDLGW